VATRRAAARQNRSRDHGVKERSNGQEVMPTLTRDHERAGSRSVAVSGVAQYVAAYRNSRVRKRPSSYGIRYIGKVYWTVVDSCVS
jgi:hypothetical protein